MPAVRLGPAEVFFAHGGRPAWAVGEMILEVTFIAASAVVSPSRSPGWRNPTGRGPGANVGFTLVRRARVGHLEIGFACVGRGEASRSSVSRERGGTQSSGGSILSGATTRHIKMQRSRGGKNGGAIETMRSRCCRLAKLSPKAKSLKETSIYFL